VVEGKQGHLVVQVWQVLEHGEGLFVLGQGDQHAQLAGEILLEQLLQLCSVGWGVQV